MVVQSKSKIITDEDLLAYGENVRAEVIDGELIVDMSPNRIEHSFYGQRLGNYFDLFASPRGLGRVFGDMGAFKLEAGPKKGSIKGALVPDCSFVSYERLPADAPLNIIPNVAPDIAVEVISDSELHTDVLKKTNYYLDHGVQLVIHILPELQQVYTFTPSDRSPAILNTSDTLTGGDVLPGFAIPVAALFEHGSTDLHVQVMRSLLSL